MNSTGDSPPPPSRFGASCSAQIPRSTRTPLFWRLAARRKQSLAATTLPRAVEEIGGVALIGWAFMLYQIALLSLAQRRGFCSRALDFKKRWSRERRYTPLAAA